MVHENSDDGSLCSKPLGYRTGHPLTGLMTLQNFIDGGCDVVGAKILVVVKATGPKKTCPSERSSVVCTWLTVSSHSERRHYDREHQRPNSRRYRSRDTRSMGNQRILASQTGAQRFEHQQPRSHSLKRRLESRRDHPTSAERFLQAWPYSKLHLLAFLPLVLTLLTALPESVVCIYGRCQSHVS